MITLRRRPWLASLALLSLAPLSWADSTDSTDQTSSSEDRTLAPISVNASETRGTLADTRESYTAKTPVSSATGLSLSERETPQSVSVVTRTQMDDFQLNGVSDVLANTTGVSVDRVETDRTYYSSRGFRITNYQYDGLGLALPYEIVSGDQDTAMFERVEVIRGATGLMNGTGNPSATVNYVRKRPTRDNHASLGLTYGSWDQRRVEADLSGSLTENGRVRGRLVSAYQNNNSYLDRYENERGLFYGVVEADLTDSTLLTLGYSQQNSNADSPLWGSLPLLYSDGTQTDFNRSSSTAADWAYWDNDFRNGFVELKQQFDNGWEARATYTYRKSEGQSELFYVYGTPNKDGTGLFAYPSYYEDEQTQNIYDLNARGPFQVGGRVHELLVGLNYSKGDIYEQSLYGRGIGTPLTVDEAFAGTYPKPLFDASEDGSDWVDRYRTAYLATRLSLADPLTAIVGARYLDAQSKGTGYTNTPKTSSANELTPYYGLIYDLDDQHSVYASYTKIFNPQAEQDASGNRLEPVEGDSKEIGLKSEWLNARINTSVAAFWTEQNNLAESTGNMVGGKTIYEGRDFESSGYEAQISGELRRGWMMTAGYTWLDVEDGEDGEHLRTYTPRDMLRLSTTYRPAVLSKLKTGMSVQWQSGISRDDEAVKQDGYALVNLMAGYDWTDNFHSTLNLYNVTDEKYLNSLEAAQAYYGAPFSASLNLKWTF
ncbi:outer membrane ferric siderophore receptor [Alcanivorax hongdengensis A-11-3]|uniref:Outer membrane ferric siderophore receptor n=1 Tax=Alcanivorax hongdengensis A-11-3 TaxID=1177179 RepID=L0W8D0_9GAMM|nr:TonB-dependent siderophore receptor [Alcanivorax hongdengensis]EKF73176.1 outer membrane ferric siderophore receptor [Alcanivorax hongdengensis A-11-3]